MRSLLLLSLVTLFAISDGVMLMRFHNKCHNDLTVVRINAYGEKQKAYKVTRTTTFCEFRSTDPVSYQLGMDGKMRTDFTFELTRTGYLLNATAGFDTATSMVPMQSLQVAGKVLKCLHADCKDAVHDNTKTPKWYYTKGDTMDITYCPENKVYVDETCLGPDYD